MLRVARLFPVAVLMLGLVACAKSDQEKAQDHAQEMVQEHNTILTDLISRGDISTSWTDEQINDYEAKLNRMDSLEQQLSGVSGTNGVIISNLEGGQRAVAQARESIQKIRSLKMKQVSLPAAIERLQTLIEDNKVQATKLGKLGDPDDNWSEAQINEYLNVLESIRSNYNQEMAILDQHSEAVQPGAREKIQQDLNWVVHLRGTATGLLNQKFKRAT